jgi:hypothetical protein
MDIRLKMLTQNTALRLYRVSKDSQLLKRLGGEWYTPQPHDAPLPTPNSERAQTMLHMLASQVHTKCPQIQPFPDLPPGAPTWDGRVTSVPRQSERDYQLSSEALVNRCWEGKAIIIFTTGVHSNKHQEDGKQLGAASAVLYHNGRDWKHTEEVFRETVTETDATFWALIVALDVLTEFLTTQQAEAQLEVIIASPSNLAISKVLNTSPHEEQDITIKCLGKIGEIITAYPNTNIKLLWLPRTTSFVGFKRAKQLALEAIWMAELDPDSEPHTIKHQKMKTKWAAITTWADRWHNAPRTSLAYRTALTKPPDGRPHPTFPTKQEPAKFSWTTSCMLYRLITGHAFIGAYTQHFFDQHTPEQIACTCGELVQTVEHILLDCPTMPSHAIGI